MQIIELIIILIIIFICLCLIYDVTMPQKVCVY